jgi:hypothetical protein
LHKSIAVACLIEHISPVGKVFGDDMFVLEGIFCTIILTGVGLMPDLDTEQSAFDKTNIDAKALEKEFELAPFVTPSSDVLWGSDLDDVIDVLDGDDLLYRSGAELTRSLESPEQIC